MSYVSRLALSDEFKDRTNRICFQNANALCFLEFMEDGRLDFQGEVSPSAKIFFDEVVRLNSEKIKELQAENIKLKEDYNELLDMVVRILSGYVMVHNNDELRTLVGRLQGKRKPL